MASVELKHWVGQKRRNALLLGFANFIVTLVFGSAILLLTFSVFFLFLRIAFFLVIPAGVFWLTLSAAVGAAFVVVVLFVDAFRAGRDEMTIIPLWVLRELFHIGPRVLIEGGRNVVRIKRLLSLDAESGAEVLAYVARKSGPVSKAQLQEQFPDMDAGRVMETISIFDGVLLLRRDRLAITLTIVLRFHLRGLLPKTLRVDTPKEPEQESEPVVVEPEQLSHHEVLGIAPGASASEIKLAYRKRIKECHPDLFAGMDEHTRRLAEQWTKAINAAYEALTTRSAEKRI